MHMCIIMCTCAPSFVYLYMYECMHVWCVCVYYVCVYVWMYVRMFVYYVCACIYVYMYELYVCVYVCIYGTYIHIYTTYGVYMCMCVWIYIYIYIHVKFFIRFDVQYLLTFHSSLLYYNSIHWCWTANRNIYLELTQEDFLSFSQNTFVFLYICMYLANYLDYLPS